MKYKVLVNFCSLFLLCFFVVAQEPLNALRCQSNTDCGSCIKEHGCIWYLRPKLRTLSSNASSILNHCMPESSKETTGSVYDIINPKLNATLIEDLPLQSRSGNVVQMKPQRIKLSMRLGEIHDFQFQYSQAENYPVDLYYIIDNSFSMKEHKAALAKLGVQLAETMTSITNDFRIGFGSFIDKMEMPFVNTLPEKLNSPCPYTNECITPYSFRNHMSLSTDFNRFSVEVTNAKLSGNLDSPEGGFDAIIQAIVCKDEIGWRPNARHLIVFSTDAQFHIAGDGKLAGLIETNEPKCHMVNNHYSGLDTDYPSISMLNHVAKENNVNLIFAVVRGSSAVLKSYEDLSKHIENSKSNGLNKDSKNVIKLVVDNYKAIVDGVRMETNATGNVEIKITPQCKNPLMDGCSNISLGEIVNFTATIRPLACVGTKNEPAIITLKPDTINERLIIELDTFCDCDCESPADASYVKNSTNCSGSGDLVCGVCVCKEKYHGNKCECDNEKAQGRNNETQCKSSEPDALMCSGLGICRCGKCDCKLNPNTGTRYRGRFCECDDDSCEKENGILCAGNGICSCGSCKCKAGWGGTSCKCPNNDRACRKEGETDICSGKGSCTCGKCECTDKYTGSYCEVCPTCEERCLELNDCVECMIFSTGKYDRNRCKIKCVPYDIKSTSSKIKKDTEEEKICRSSDENKCEITYKYKYDQNENLIVTVQEKKNCGPNILVWILTVIGFVLLIGLLTLLIWKIAITIIDKREFAKFTNEQKKSRWNANQNPLYKEATTTFENPHYPH